MELIGNSTMQTLENQFLDKDFKPYILGNYEHHRVVNFRISK